jgi:hypothetical protein
LLAHARALLAGLGSAELGRFLREWPARTPSRHPAPAAVPALRWLAELQSDAPAFSAPLVDALASAAASLEWRRSYSPEAVGAVFYDNYGWTELAGNTGPVASDRLACGVLILGPRLTYPSHRHEAEEIYVPLAGAALWQRGAGPWREQSPGAVIRHARHEPHAMQTLQSPLLALYLWRSRDLNQKSRLVAPDGEDPRCVGRRTAG